MTGSPRRSPGIGTHSPSLRNPQIRAAELAAFVDRRRWWILGCCALLNALFVVREALFGSAHNGWIYQHGDDGPWYWTSAWSLASLHIPKAAVGLGWPYLLAPLARVFGPNMADGLPAVVVVNVAILGPLGVLGMYLLGERIAGRLYGIWCAVVWIALPAVALLLYRPQTRPSVIDSFIPTATGLNALSDYPSMICAIFGAYLIMRALDRGAFREGLLAGAVLGFLVLLKPANAPLLLVAVVVLLVARRFGALAAVAAGSVPALAALAVWKRRGLGDLPILPSQPGETGGARQRGLPARLYDRLDHGVHQYVQIDWHHLAASAHDLREVFWSLRLLEFVLLAGSLAVVWRARWKGVVVVGWFLGYGLIKATNPQASIKDTSVYRYLLPAWPAWALLVASLVFLWPRGRAARARAAGRVAAHARLPGHVVVAALVILGALPLAATLVSRPVARDSVAQDFVGSPIPVVGFHLLAQRARDGVELRWSGVATDRATFAYRVFRDTHSQCKPPGPGPPICVFDGTPIATTAKTSFFDRDAPERSVYRIGLAAGWSAEQTSGNLLLLSRDVAVGGR